MKLKVVDARTIDFTPYGKLFNLRAEGEGLCYSCAADYTGSYTAAPVIDTLGSLGYTKSAGLPFTAEQMERHGHTQEAQIPESQPIVFLVAPATDAPQCERRKGRYDSQRLCCRAGPRGVAQRLARAVYRKLLLLAGECIRGRTDGMAAH